MILLLIKRSKFSYSIKTDELYQKFNLFRPFLIYFQSLSIDFKLFDSIRLQINQFCQDNCFGFQDFVSKIQFASVIAFKPILFSMLKNDNITEFYG